MHVSPFQGLLRKPLANVPAAQHGFIFWPFLGVLAVAAVVSGACGGAPASRGDVSSGVSGGGWATDVLLITVDTLRADVLGFAGGMAATPSLDALAARGRVFERSYAHNVVTLPSHANILSGRYPFDHGVRDNSGFRFPDSTATMATALAEAGFETAAVVGAFPLRARYGLARGFDLYDDRLGDGWSRGEFSQPERSGEEVVARGLEWWRDHEGAPRFLWVHLYDPHAPYEAPEPFAGRHPEAPYLGEVEAVDHYLRPLLDEAAGEDSLIVFTSDHGEALGEHGEATHGLFAYEATLAVPLVLAGGGVEVGRDQRIARHVDLLPTVLDATGVQALEPLPGFSLLQPAATDTQANSAYFESLTTYLSRGWAPLFGTVVGQHKYIELPVPELYDLAADPDEATNLAETSSARASELRRSIPRTALELPSPDRVSDAERAQLEALGYLGGSPSTKSEFGPEDDPKALAHLDAKLQSVVGAVGQAQWPRAVALAREILAERPMASAYRLLAEALLELGQPRQAVAALDEAARKGQTDPSLVRQHSRALVAAGQPARAVALLKPLVDEGDVDTLETYGSVLVDAGQPLEGLAAFDRALVDDPEHPLLHEGRARALLALGRFPEAVAAARRGLEIDSGLSLTWNYLGGALYNQGSVIEAIEAWDRSVQLDPGNFDAHFNLAVVALEAQETERAHEALKAFVEGAPASEYGPDLERARGWLQQLEAGRSPR